MLSSGQEPLGPLRLTCSPERRRPARRGSRNPTCSVLGQPDPALPDRVHHGLRAIVHGELAQDRAHVVLDGLLAQGEREGHLLVGRTLGDVVEDLRLAGRERGEDRGGRSALDDELAKLPQDPRGKGGARERDFVNRVLAVRDPAHDRDQIVRVDVLSDERGGACFERLDQCVLVLVGRQDHDGRRGQLPLDPPHGLDPTEGRQREVEQDHVRCGLLRLLDSDVGVRRLAGHREVWLTVEDARDAEAERGPGGGR